MIIGIGVDVIEIDRIKKALDKSQSFALKILTSDELDSFERLKNRRQLEYLAGRFAAKEAFSKAIGTGIGKVSFHDINISNNDSGAPIMVCHKFSGHIHLSISHSDTVAVAQVVLEDR